MLVHLDEKFVFISSQRSTGDVVMAELTVCIGGNEMNIKWQIAMQIFRCRCNVSIANCGSSSGCSCRGFRGIRLLGFRIQGQSHGGSEKEKNGATISAAKASTL